MRPTLLSTFRALRRTDKPPIYDPGFNGRLTLIEIEIEHKECIRNCTGILYSNDTTLQVENTVYKIRGRDDRALKTTFFNESAHAIKLYEEGQFFYLMPLGTSYSPPYACVGEISAEANGHLAALGVTTERRCDCGDETTYIDAEPIGGFLL